jgi:late competence protein required for DNA uptake (superfamily II DNA/RNA helicase)
MGKVFLTKEILDMIKGMDMNNYIERYGILLEDVLISRDKALKRDKVSFTEDYICNRCGNNKLEEFYASNSKKCWEDLCGVGGTCIFCNRCMDIVEFEQTCVS